MASRKGGKGRGGGRSGKGGLLKALLLLGILVATLAAVFVLLVLRPYENRPRPAGKASPKASAGPRQAGKAAARPAAPVAPAASRRPAPPGPGGAAGDLPLLAIVIDDMGYQPKLDEELLRLDLNLTFAFLPHGPYTAQQAKLAGSLEREVLLHFPMEPDDHRWDPGPGAVTTGMARARLREVFEEDLALVPQAVGINNHMGSRFTRDHAAMQDFLALVRDRRLFFLDSLTSQESVGYVLAREMGVKAARRQVFLDNDRDQARITGQIRELLASAERQGWAVGIGHPSPATLAALRAAAPEILARTRVVGVSRLAH